jgi:hypothetical protein
MRPYITDITTKGHEIVWPKGLVRLATSKYGLVIIYDVQLIITIATRKVSQAVFIMVHGLPLQTRHSTLVTPLTQYTIYMAYDCFPFIH